MFKSIGLVFCMSSVLLADVLAPAEVGVEKVVQVFSQMVTRQITSEAQAVLLLGKEGKALFAAYQALKKAGRIGDLSPASVNYTELTKALKNSGTSGLKFVERITELSQNTSSRISMNDLLTSDGLPKARPNMDVLAVLERAPEVIRNRFSTPTNELDRLNQTDVAEMVIAAEEGARLCTDRTACLNDNMGTIAQFNLFGLLSRPASRKFFKDAVGGFGRVYRGSQLNTISRNLNRHLLSAARVSEIEPGIQSCVLTGQPGNN